jgi:hypothetical protein
MNTPTNGGDSEPRSYAEARLRTCGRIISLAPDKLAALTNLACGFARDIRDGYLSQLAVADRLHELADAYGLIAEHGIDVVQRAIAQNMESESAPAQAWPALSHEAVPTPNPLGGPVTTLDVGEFLAREFQPREMMFAPWLPTQGIAMIHAERGIGKTHVALGTAWAIHVGARFLRWTAPQPRRVLLLDGEMPAVALKERLAHIAEVSEYPAQRANLKIAAADLTRDGLPDLSDPAAQRLYSKVVEDADLVIVDNISALCRMMKENDADAWTPVQNWALQLRRAGKSVILIHHAGKSGRQRGTSRKEDVLDGPGRSLRGVLREIARILRRGCRALRGVVDGESMGDGSDQDRRESRHHKEPERARSLGSRDRQTYGIVEVHRSAEAEWSPG